MSYYHNTNLTNFSGFGHKLKQTISIVMESPNLKSKFERFTMYFALISNQTN